MHRAFQLAALFALFAPPPASAQNAWTRVSDYPDLRTLTVLDDGTVLAGTETDGLRSTDRGVSFDTLRFVRESGTGDIPSDGVTPTRDGINQFAATTFFGQSRMTVFAAGEDGGYRSVDGGSTWMPGPRGITPDGCALAQSNREYGFLEYATVSVASDGTIVFGGRDDDNSPDCKSKGHTFLSTDKGATWVDLGYYTAYSAVLTFPGAYVRGSGSSAAVIDTETGGLASSSDLGPGSIKVLARSPTGSLYAGLSGYTDRDGDRTISSGVWRLPETGREWVRINAGLPSLDVTALLALDNGRLLAGTFDAGLFVSTNGGASWARASDGLDPTNDRDANGVPDARSVLALAVGPDAVWVSTRGGLYKSSAFAVADEAGPDETIDEIHLQSYPNPAHSTATVEVGAPTGPITVEVFDVRGRSVAMLHDGPAAGPIRLTADVTRWPAGVYAVRVTTSVGVASTRLVVVR